MLVRSAARAVRATSVVLLTCATAAVAQELQRFDIARFAVPTGWTRADADGAAVLQSADGKASIRLSKSAPYAGNLRAVAEAKLAEARQKFAFVEQAGRSGDVHARTGGEWQGYFYSYEDGAKTVLDWTLCIGAGKRYVLASLLTASPDDYALHVKTFGPWCDALQLTTAEIVEKGRPNLTRFALDETIDFIEWLVHSPLTAEQRATIETEVRGFWTKKLREEMDGIVEMLKARADLAKLKPEERELVRQVVLDEALAEWRKDTTSPAAEMLLQVHAAVNQPIAPGEPPLVRQAVDAYAEYLYFAAGKAAGMDDVQVEPETKQRLAEEVAKGYAALPKERRELIAEMPATWAALRVAWPEFDAAQRQQLLDAWRQDSAMQKLGPQLSAISMRSLLSRQAQLQAQQLHFQTMSNIMRMQHDTMRIIASNMGGNTRYEYRW